MKLSIAMSKATIEQIESSILELAKYRDRLTNEVNELAKKLRMPKEKINSTIANHKELNQIKQAISNLTEQKNLFFR